MKDLKCFRWITILMILLIIPCYISSAEIPRAQKGVLDLSNWDFATDGVVELNGEWKYVIGNNYNPEDREKLLSKSNIFNVPDYWNSIIPDGKGTAWYMLDLYLPDNINVELGVYLKYAFTCYELYINNEKVLGRGIVNDSIKNIPQFLPDYSKIKLTGNVLSIAWKISNYHDAKGGPFYPLIIGKYDKIQNIQTKTDSVGYFQLFFVFTIFLFHLSLWMSRKKEIDYLIFSLCSLSIFIRTVGTAYSAESCHLFRAKVYHPSSSKILPFILY